MPKSPDSYRKMHSNKCVRKWPVIFIKNLRSLVRLGLRQNLINTISINRIAVGSVANIQKKVRLSASKFGSR